MLNVKRPLFSSVKKLLVSGVVSAALLVVYIPSAQAQAFPDVPASHPNAEAIDFLSKEGIFSGYPDGFFRPDNPVNRAEALKILLFGSGVPVLQSKAADAFPDVSKADWFSAFVAVARERSVVAGYPDGFFRPEQTVNLVEALKMLLKINAVDLTNYQVGGRLYADTYSGAWYNPFLAYAKRFEVVEPNGRNQITPGGALTRGELAEIVYRFTRRVAQVCPKFFQNTQTYPRDYFATIQLQQDFPSSYFEDEIYLFRGRVSNGAMQATAFFTDEYGEQSSFVADTNDGQFEIPVEFKTPGFYNFSILPGTSGKSFAAGVEVLPRECVPATVEFSQSTPQAIRTGVEKNLPVVSWSNGSNNLARLVLRQGALRFERLLSANQTSHTFSPIDFAGWQKGPATLQIYGARSENGYSFEPRTRWEASQSVAVELGEHHFSDYLKEGLVLDNFPVYREPELSISGRAATDLEPEAYLIDPAGAVTAVPLAGSTTKALAAGKKFTLDLKLPQVGTYILEINNSSGVAVLNTPLYSAGELPLLPDFNDQRVTATPLTNLSLTRERNTWLSLINSFRRANKLGALVLNSELNTLAQNYAEQMARRNFFGHVDPEGQNPDDRRNAAGYPLPVAENLAQEINTSYAELGLERSPAHRLNLLNPDFQAVGLGVAQNKEGQNYFVQYFSEAVLNLQNLSQFRAELLGKINETRQAEKKARYVYDEKLLAVAQAWSDQMLAEDFIDFERGGSSLEKKIRSAGYKGAFTAFIASAPRFDQIAAELKGKSGVWDAEFSKLTIGLTQSTTGAYYVTLIFY